MVAAEEVEESTTCKPPRSHQCSSTDKCIDPDLVCDQKCDCSNCTDENNCCKSSLFTLSCIVFSDLTLASVSGVALGL